MSATNRVVLHSTSCIDCLSSRLGNCLNEKPDQPDHPATPENKPRCLNDHSDSVNEPDSVVPRALAVSISQEVMTNETGEMYSLPAFSVAQEPNFMRAEVDSVSFAGAVDSAYTEVIHWCRNVFNVPSGKTGKAFVAELSRFLRAYANGSTLETIALKCAMILPSLLLQKPHKTSKAKDHI